MLREIPVMPWIKLRSSNYIRNIKIVKIFSTIELKTSIVKGKNGL